MKNQKTSGDMRLDWTHSVIAEPYTLVLIRFDYQRGLPVPGTGFLLLQEDIAEPVPCIALTDESGKAVFSDLTPGNYTISQTTETERYLPLPHPLNIQVDFYGNIHLNDATIPYLLLPAVAKTKLTIQCTVKNAPLPGILFTLTRFLDGQMQDEAESSLKMTDNQGQIHFTHLIPGTYQLKAEKSRFAVQNRTTLLYINEDGKVMIDGEQKDVLLFTATPTASVRFSVVCESPGQHSHPQLGAELIMVSHETGKSHSAFTASNGIALFDSMAPGRYTCTLMNAHSCSVDNQPITIVIDEFGVPFMNGQLSNHLTIRLTAHSSDSLYFFTADKENKPIAGVEFILRSSKQTLRAESDARGKVIFTGPSAAQQYEMTALAPIDYQMPSKMTVSFHEQEWRLGKSSAKTTTILMTQTDSLICVPVHIVWFDMQNTNRTRSKPVAALFRNDIQIDTMEIPFTDPLYGRYTFSGLPNDAAYTVALISTPPGYAVKKIITDASIYFILQLLTVTITCHDVLEHTNLLLHSRHLTLFYQDSCRLYAKPYPHLSAEPAEVFIAAAKHNHHCQFTYYRKP